MTKPYHHGDLPAALLRAAGDILRTQGLSALTLRAVARRAGVSHTAPAPHFGDLTGLLSELAAEGYRQFNASLASAQACPGERSPSLATAHAYVDFAHRNPAMFLLMFRSERLDFARPALAEAALNAQRLLVATTGRELTGASGLGAIGAAIGSWSVVHGFALLLIDGRLDGALQHPDCNGDPAVLLDAALSAD